ncbi:hypothetical protein F4809DRAFT_636858 [Biscogniauxia mediterranea]|nr:hypothetical protein F4809DRAFT_636858 [Biscogniauxia mediterranea]
MAWLRLYLKPYPGIPYNEAYANRITGGMSDLVPVIKEMDESSNALFPITTRKLGTPIAQLLFPGFRKPLVILEDPREIEDILVRRNKEFDKAPMALDIFSPMFPRASIGQLRAQKRLWVDVMGVDFLRKATAPNIYKATIELIELWRLKASTVYKDRTFSVYEDFKDAALMPPWTPSGSQCDTIARNSNHPAPKWAQKFETYTPRYRKFRSTVTAEIGEGDEEIPAP